MRDFEQAGVVLAAVVGGRRSDVDAVANGHSRRGRGCRARFRNGFETVTRRAARGGVHIVRVDRRDGTGAIPLRRESVGEGIAAGRSSRREVLRRAPRALLLLFQLPHRTTHRTTNTDSMSDRQQRRL